MRLRERISEYIASDDPSADIDALLRDCQKRIDEQWCAIKILKEALEMQTDERGGLDWTARYALKKIANIAALEEE